MEAFQPDVAIGDDQEKKKEVVEKLKRIQDVKWPLGAFSNVGVLMGSFYVYRDVCDVHSVRVSTRC